MKEYAKSFYKGREWQKCSRAYMQSRNYICERCGSPAAICHHKIYLTPATINDPEITLNWSNLEALCHNCHDLEHLQQYNKTYFNEDGSIEKIKESKQIQEHKKAADDITEMLAVLQAERGRKAAINDKQ